MSGEQRENTIIYTVVCNEKEQYSIWVAERDLPIGWRAVGKTGLKAECLAYIDEIWSDSGRIKLGKNSLGA